MSKIDLNGLPSDTNNFGLHYLKITNKLKIYEMELV